MLNYLFFFNFSFAPPRQKTITYGPYGYRNDNVSQTMECFTKRIISILYLIYNKNHKIIIITLRIYMPKLKALLHVGRMEHTGWAKKK